MWGIMVSHAVLSCPVGNGVVFYVVTVLQGKPSLQWEEGGVSSVLYEFVVCVFLLQVGSIVFRPVFFCR